MPSTPLLAFFFSGPFSVLATAAGAVSVPIIIHLLNRKRFRIVPWAAMRFLLAAQKKNSRRLRLEQLLLLAVRALIVLLVILAMASVTGWAEDFWNKALGSAGSHAGRGGRRTHRILVLDGSLSMGLKAGESTCFEKARELAARIVQDSAPGDGFSVVLMASSPRRIVGGPSGPSENARKVLAEIENLRLPHGNSDLAGTLESVFDLLKQSPGKFPEKEVYFLTDLQKTSWVLPQPGQVARALSGIQERARTVLLDVGTDRPPDNLAVTHLALDPGRLVATTSGDTLFTAVVHNHGAATPGAVRARLYVGKLPARAGDKLDMQPGESQTQRLGRGPNNVSFKHHFTSPGEYVVQVRLDGDALDLDDTRSVIVSVRERVPVLLVDGKTAPDPFDRATEYLFDALNPYQDVRPGVGLGGPAVVRPRPNAPVRPRQITAAEFSTEDRERGDLSREDCVFLCDVPRLSVNEAKRLETHVLRGGGLVVCLGPNVDLASYNDVLYRNGQGLLPARLLARQRAPKDHFFHFSADESAFRRAPLSAFGQERFRVRLLAAPFTEFIRTEVPTAPAGGPAPRKLLTFLTRPEKPDQPKSADPALYLREAALLDWQPVLPQLSHKDRAGATAVSPVPANRGRVLLYTSTVNTDWTDWPRQGTFVWLMQELLGHAASGRLRERSLSVGDTLEEFLPGASEAEGKEVTLRTPDGRTERLRTRANNDVIVWRWSDSDVSGVYWATIGDNPVGRAFAVNFPASTPDMQSSESNLARTTKEELNKIYPEWEIQVVRDPSEAVHDGRPLVPGDGRGGAAPAEHGSHIARWLLLVALALLAAEVVLAWYFGHYSAVHERDRAPHGWARGKYAGYLRVGLGVTMGLLVLFTLAAAATLAHAAWTGDFLGFLPDSWRASFEQARNVPSPSAGEGRRWGLETVPYLGESRIPDPWLVGLLAVALGVGAWFIYRREGRVVGGEGGQPRRGGIAVMLALRIGMFLLMLTILMPQLRVWFERQSWPDVVILIDDSASMGRVDDFRDPRVKEVAERLAREAGLEAKERLRLAQALLTRPDGDWLTELLARRQVKVHVYHCSAGAEQVASFSKQEEVADARSAVLGLEAKKEHDSSLLGAAVRRVLNDFRTSSLAAIIMLTDGVTTEGEEDLAQVSKYAASLKVPLFFVGIGDSQESRDVAVHDLEVAEAVFVNDNLIFRPSVTVKGYGDKPGPVTLRLREKDSPKVLATQVVTPEAAGKPTRARLEYRPKKPGIKTFVIDTDIRPDEVDRENNSVTSPPVTISEVKLTRVLYVDGYGRWEFRYVKTLLERESERDKNKKLIDLSVYLVEADDDFWEEDKSARKLKGRLPTREELEKFHVIILGDLDPHPRANAQAMKDFLQNVADVVRDNGRGLLMIAGERFAPHAYKDTPLRDVLPIDITSDRPPEEPEGGRTDGYKPELTPLGRMHEIFSFDEKDPDPVWKKLRPFYWYAEGYAPKRAAEVLVVHPAVKSQPGGSKEGKHPLVVQQFVGGGRSMFFGFNETWRWRWREDELRFNQFWLHTIRYLRGGHQGNVRVRTDRQKYMRGQPMKIMVRFPNNAQTPGTKADVRVVVVNRDSRERRTVRLSPAAGSRGTFEGTLTRTPVGHYDLWLAQPRVPDPQPKAECRVLAPPGELEEVRMNQSEMETAARETRGRFYTLADADQLLDDLPSGNRVTVHAPGEPWLVWNHALLLVMALLFLSAEWIMRKRYHLL